ncbi:hypothetical protein M1D72_08700 [Vibrio sp. AK197]
MILPTFIMGILYFLKIISVGYFLLTLRLYSFTLTMMNAQSYITIE